MSVVAREQVKADLEGRIITGMIVSDSYIRQVIPMVKLEYFDADYAKIVLVWLKEYFLQYKRAPKKDIEDVFKERQDDMEETKAVLVADFLSSLSENFEQEYQFNLDYLLDQTREYIRKKSLRVTVDRLQQLLEVGRYEKAETELQAYRKISMLTSNWVNPLDSEYIKQHFINKDNGEDALLQFPGALGKLIGPLSRDWLVAFLGSPKKGKCIVEGSKVLLANGRFKNIEDIVHDKDIEIISFNEETGKMCKAKIVHHWSNGSKTSFEVTTRSGRISRVTGNHPYLTVSGWKALEELHVGDYIAVPKNYPIEGEKSWPDWKARLLAYLIADGNFENLSFTKQSKRMQIDFDYCVDKMGDRVTRKAGSITGYIVKKETSALKKYNPSKTFTRQWMNSISVKYVLSKYKELPAALFELNNRTLKQFLATLFSCDGSIYSTNGNQVGIEYTSASKKLTYHVNHLLLRFGIVGKINNKIINAKDGKIFESWSIVINSKESIKSFINQIGFTFEKQEKANVLEKRLSKVKSGRSFLTNFPACFSSLIIKPKVDAFLKRTGAKDRAWHRSKGISNLRWSLRIKSALTPQVLSVIANKICDEELKRWVLSDVFFDKIVSITSLGMQNTYDLAVSGTHNFIADDVLVHNTWWLIETAIQSLLNKKRVVFFSLEMSARRVEDRLLSRMSSAGDKSTDYVYPVFDCWENQTGECKRVERVNKTRLLTDDDTLPDFKESMKYRVCTTCRGTNAFKPATWYIQKTRGKVTMRNSIRKANAIRRMYGDYLRIRSFPMNSASTGDIRSELDALENNEGFIPDVCIVDYADLLRPEDTRLSDVRARLDNIWKMLKNLADTRHVLVVTASQGNRASIKKKDIGQVDIAEDIRKLAHLDLMLSLNQTDDEKERGTMRIGIVAHRDGDFNPKKQVMTLQQRSVGQTLLDSEFVPPKKKKGKSFDDEDE